MFKAHRLALAGALLACLVSDGLADAAARRKEALEAEQVILQTHLFTDGRGMHIVPGIFNLYELVQKPEIPVDMTWGVKYLLGFNMQGRRAIGLFNIDVQGSKVGVLGCVGCHGGRAAGRFFVGLGNKNIDVGMVGRVAQKFSKPYHWTRHLRPLHEQKLIDQAMGFTRILANPNWMNLSQGMVPVSNVWQWFYRQAGLPAPEHPARGAVKVAHLWGYAEKRKAGLFSDGFGDGTHAGWAAAVEMTAGQLPGTIRGYYHRLEALEKLFEKLLPPPYPFAIDLARADQGRAVFAQNCAACHGTYRKDADGMNVFEKPVHVPLEVVGTDPDRVDTVTPQFRELVKNNPLNDLLKPTGHGRGYFAPRLDGIWARFPYLHNTSVPNVWALLTPPDRRPRAWSLEDAGEAYRFDPSRLGLTLPVAGSGDAGRLLDQAKKGARDVFWVERIGHSNQGHPFGTALSDADKRALIEYLKTL